MDSQEEKIIRSEGRDFAKHELDWHSGGSPVSRLHKLQSRLTDFYTPEYKAIFLDEIETTLRKDLQTHRDRAHGGKPSDTCYEDTDTEKILFFVKQELSILPVVAHQRGTKKSELERSKVFVSYSHADQKYLDDIKRHFKPFGREIDFWDDSRISPGQKWKETIKQAIKETKVAILLVSSHFLGSDFIATDELPPLLQAAQEEGAVILILIVEPCLFEDFPSLNQYQAVNSPDRTVASMDFIEKENLYVNLVRQTKRVLNNQAN